jgi:RNA ligase (TIGR02306 family)
MRKLASIQTINAIEPIPRADTIERVRVLGWWVVAKRGQHHVGEQIVYCEIDSLLPERPEFEFLRPSSFKPSQTDDSGAINLPAGFRIKTIRLRGQVSQGICFPMWVMSVLAKRMLMLGECREDQRLPRRTREVLRHRAIDQAEVSLFIFALLVAPRTEGVVDTVQSTSST